MESPLACSPRKAHPFLHLQLTCPNPYALQTTAITTQSALISLESSKGSLVAHSSYLPPPLEASLLPSLSPTHSAPIAKHKEGGKGAVKLLPTAISSFRLRDVERHQPAQETLTPTAHQASQGCLEKQQQTSADTSNYTRVAETRSVIDLFLEGRTSYPVKRGVTLLNSERIITQRRGHSRYCYTSALVSKPDREQRSSERFSVHRQA